MLVLESGDKLRGDASAAAVVDYTIHGIIGSIPTQFADGQLAAIIGDLYTSAGIVIVASITLVNTDSVARTVNLYLTPSGGTARRLIAKDLSLAAGYSLMFDGNKFEVIDTFGQIATTRTSALIGPAASTANAVVRFSGTTGKLAKDSTAVVIDDSNNVGIGTTSPNNQLHLYKTSGDATLKLESDDAGRGIITIDGTRTVDDLLSTIVTSNAGDTVASISVGREGANDAGYMAFATQKTGEANTERMRIDSAGNVGIGTASPIQKVQIDGDAALLALNHPTTSSYNQIGFYDNLTVKGYVGYLGTTFGGARQNTLELYTQAGVDLTFLTAGTERMRILAAGNVGIGDTAPATTLSVSSASVAPLSVYAPNGGTIPAQINTNGSSYLVCTANHSSGQGEFDIINNNYGAAGAGGIWFEQATAASTFLTTFVINRVGSVGIGTGTFGNNAEKVLGILNGTAPVTAPPNMIQIYSADTADNTATLGLMLEQAVEAIGVFTASHKIKVFINGTAYWIQLDAV